jgi:hypothetical protein
VALHEHGAFPWHLRRTAKLRVCDKHISRMAHHKNKVNGNMGLETARKLGEQTLALTFSFAFQLVSR